MAQAELESILDVDALIFGGGAAGLFAIDELHRRGYRVVLIESSALGAGQTIAAQGILHSGLKYALKGFLTRAADAAGEMTEHWQRFLAGEEEPNLTGVGVNSTCCYLWRTESISSMLGLVGAKLGLRTPVVKVDVRERPAALTSCPGEVLRVDEPVIDVPSLMEVMASRHRERTFRIDVAEQVHFEWKEAGRVVAVTIRATNGNEEIRFRPSFVVLTAGEGNEALRARVGLRSTAMQRRPLHMVMLRGAVPRVFGHCVDGAKTRVTITSHVSLEGRVVWQIGGNVAEEGIGMSPGELIAFAKREIGDVLPGVNFNGAEWATYRINRAEGVNDRGLRPDGPDLRCEGNVLTAWPTKLVLAPKLAQMLADHIVRSGRQPGQIGMPIPSGWQRPSVALPPWDSTDQWQS